MCLDSETKIVLAEELEDVAMELANISQHDLTDTSDESAVLAYCQSIQAETERLSDIAELYEYKALLPITLWVNQNVLALTNNAIKRSESSENGLFITWIELLAASLQQADDELSSELKIALLDPAWATPVNASSLQQLLDSLNVDEPVDTEIDQEPESHSGEQLVITTQDISTPPLENTQESSYRLAPDDDVHPELLEAFYIETPDQVIEVAELIREISEGNSDKAMQQSAARIAHTIKGSSAVVGLEAVASFAHRLEDILEYSVEHPLPPEVAELLVESSDCLEAMFDSLITQSLPPQHYPALLEQLTQWDKKFSAGYIYEQPIVEQPKEKTHNKADETSKTNKKPTNKHKKNSSYELAWNKDVHPELLEAYMGETPEHVVEIAQLLRDINQQTNNTRQKKSQNIQQTYQKASQLAHTIKGTSATVGINAIANIGQPLEEILDYAIENDLPPSLLPLLDESADLLESLYDSLLSEGVPPKEYPALHKKLCAWQQHLPVDSLTKKESSEAPPVESAKEVPQQAKASKAKTVIKSTAKISSTDNALDFTLTPPDKILTAPSATTAPVIQRTNLNEAILRVPVSVIDKLLGFSSELITANTQMADQINTLLNDRRNSNERNERIRNMLDELEWAVNQQSASSHTPKSINVPSKTTDSVAIDSLELDSYNELHSITNLLSESIEDDRKTSISLARQLNELKSQTQSQKQINNDLNNTVLNMRMEVAKILSARLQRIVRETCRQTKKQAELDIIGDELALDTDIIKGLSDPLLHLLRNAVDHGIESEEIRSQHKKNKVGKIQLRFAQHGDQVVLILKDDGAGIDPEKVYQSAIKKGLIDKEEALSEEEKLRLILLAGFSTRDNVSETSGRGVGMDVVNSAVQNLSGNIAIESTINKGTEIRIQVPLTLSVANVLLVDVLGNTLAIPNASIQQLYYVEQKSIKEKEGKLFIHYQQHDIPVLALSSFLSWPTSRLIIDKSQSVLILKHHNQHYALYVDKILKPLNITIKTLKPWMTNILGVNGVCLLPNGVVAPVLNLFDILRTTLQKALDTSINITDSASININQNKILVVDDSLSNRTALRLMLESMGHDVGTAVDGADALQQLEKTPFKLVVTDLEMPNMNGLEMVESLRVWAETKNLPIIMITSRSTSKHRALAAQAGVDDYLTKPVDSNTLQATVAKYTASEQLDKVGQ
jgi:chemosensory pili system protein ChpA (sensor histidine kinase/response regulator)